MHVKIRIYTGCLLVANYLLLTTLRGQPEEPVITLEEVTLRTLLNHPKLTRTNQQKSIAEEAIAEAGLKPDLELETELENFLGSGDYSGIQALELTVSLHHVIERGGKRELRQSLASKAMDGLHWEETILRQEIENSVRTAYAEVLLAQQNLELQLEWLELEKESFGAVENLVANAGASTAELARAELAVEQQRFVVESAGSDLEKSKAGLAKLWGNPSSTGFLVTGYLGTDPTLPNWEELLAALDSSPYLARYDNIRAARLVELDLEKSKHVQDISVFGGVRHGRESRDNALVAGFSIPLPSKQRYEGRMRSAQTRLRMVELERDAARRQMMESLSDAYHSMRQASIAIQSLDQRLLPAAQVTLEEIQKGYQRGQFSQQAVLESRKALFEIRQQKFEALSRYLKAKTQIENLTQAQSI